MDNKSKKKIAVMGYLCLDIYPDIHADNLEFVPGMLQEVGRCEMAPGGVIGNTGLALRKLGVPVQLIGKTGNDGFGRLLNDLLSESAPDGSLAVASEDGDTSYSIVLSPTGSDRMFLAHRGINDTLKASDAQDALQNDVALLHFGYPPLCRKFAVDEGKELRRLFAYARNSKIITSLDMSLPSPGSFSYSLDWPAYLRSVMPFVDIFMPSVDELKFMLKPKRGEQLEELCAMSGELLGFGGGVIGIKLGSDGLYVRTTDDRDRLAFLSSIPDADIDCWVDKEFIVPCLEVDVKGTTGAGDCTIAGFLADVVNGCDAESAAWLAVGAGACSVSARDAVSGIKPLTTIRRKLEKGWSARRAPSR